MNRSYSKIRHIQETNQRLELRHLLKEQEKEFNLDILKTLAADNKNLLGRLNDESWKEFYEWIIQDLNKTISTENKKKLYDYFSRTSLKEYYDEVKELYDSLRSPALSIDSKPKPIQSSSLPKSNEDKVNPIQIGQQIPIYTDKNSQKLMGYVRVTNITENPSSTTGLFADSKFDVEIDTIVLPGFKFKFMDIMFRDFNFNNKSDKQIKESKENLTIYFSCQKEGLKIGNKKTKSRYTDIVFSPDITNYFTNKICNKNEIKSQEELPQTNVDYWYVKDNEQIGPKNINEIKELIKKREINIKTLIWKTGGQWQSAENYLELKDILSTMPPPISTSSSPKQTKIY